MDIFVGAMCDIGFHDDGSFDTAVAGIAEGFTQEDSTDGQSTQTITQKRDDRSVLTNTMSQDEFMTQPLQIPRVPRQIITRKSATRSKLRPEVAQKIHGGSKKTTQKAHDRYANLYYKYCEETDQEEWKEVSACHFYHDKLNDGVFGIGSVWTIYACINAALQKNMKMLG